MTEAEWLASSNPAAMLRYLFPPDHVTVGLAKQFRPGDRQLRLWVEACRVASGTKDPFFNLDDSDGLQGAVKIWSTGGGPVLTAAQKAAILRDIVGNLYRPVKVRVPLTCRRGHPFTGPINKKSFPVPLSLCVPCGEDGPPWPDVLRGKPPDWISPQVLSLAQAAYEERPGRKCSYPHNCPGMSHKSGCNCGSGQGANSCPRCHGTGRIEDGTLDSFRLGLLADALEEAGANDEDILRHLRGWEPCVQRPRGQPDYIHGWCYLSSPHVRGCWALDLILGKE